MSNLIRWNPLRDMMRMRSEIDRMFDDAFNAPLAEWSEETNWGLPLDVAENDDAFVVKASVPGMNPEDLEITLTDNTLTIKGEVKADETIDEERYHVRERRYGRFTRSLSLPVPVESDDVDATYENGILTLNIPKAEMVKPKRISIKAETNGQKVIEG